MMDRFEMITPNAEQIVNGPVDTEKTVGLEPLIGTDGTTNPPVLMILDGKRCRRYRDSIGPLSPTGVNLTMPFKPAHHPSIMKL